jgi:hypothetical protein
MPRRSCPFTETDVKRAVRAVRAAGLEVCGVEIDRERRRIIVITDKDRVVIDMNPAPDDEVEAWIKKQQQHAH